MKGFIVLCFGLLPFVLAQKVRLRYHPTPADPDNRIIWLNGTSYDYWSKQLDSFLEVYRTTDVTPDRSNNSVVCAYNARPPKGKVCRVDVESFNPCVSSNKFGYKEGTPCVFIEIPKIVGWEPNYYNNMKCLPKEMPTPVKDQIGELTKSSALWKTVWLSCEGQHPVDKENIGVVSYIPNPGFPGYYFPYTEQAGFLNPLVAVQFLNPKAGVLIRIECKLWGPGINHDYRRNLGFTQFELLLY